MKNLYIYFKSFVFGCLFAIIEWIVFCILGFAVMGTFVRIIVFFDPREHPSVFFEFCANLVGFFIVISALFIWILLVPYDGIKQLKKDGNSNWFSHIICYSVSIVGLVIAARVLELMGLPFSIFLNL